MLSTPVLLIVFNRPEIARKAFDQIRKVQPRHLFIAADGPRADKPEDILKCAATREIINQIDWECDLKTLFREQNRGCGHGPAEAITWFFEHVERGIILEDDCLADSSFFPFCEQLLEKYKYDERISMIGGTNPLISWKNTKSSYIFSNMGFSWGWASWRRAWKHFDYSAALWQTEEGKERVRSTLNQKLYYKHFASEFDSYFKVERPDVWDFQWYFCRLSLRSHSIIPTVNLVSNIGFNGDGTHTFDIYSKMNNLASFTLDFPLEDAPFKIDRSYDWLVFERFINQKDRPLWKKIILKSIKMVNKNY